MAASIADAAAVNPYGIKTHLASGSNTFFINGNSIFSNFPKSLPKNLPDFPILCNWVFNTFILTDKPFAKALRNFETCVLVNNNLCGKLFSSLESATVFGEILKVASIQFFIPNFNLLICKLDNFTFIVLYWVILYWYYIKAK